MIFMLSNKGHIKLSEQVLQKIRTYCQRNKIDSEAGGILLGRFLLNSKDIIIDEITVPMIGDKSSRYSFYRSAKIHQNAINAAWNKSDGTCHYLGEWHTHPEDYPQPSRRDIVNWNNHLKRDIFSNRYLYFIIAGNKDISVWEGDRRNLKINKLKTAPI